MDFGSFNIIPAAIGGLSSVALIFIGLLAASAFGGACIGIYVGIRSGIEIWNIKRARRLRRKARMGQRATMQHAHK